MTNELGDFLKTIRAEKNLTLRDLANLTGLSHSYLHNLETGLDPRTGKPVSPTVTSLEKLADGLDIPVQKIIFIGSTSLETIMQRSGRINRLEATEGSGKPPQAYELDYKNLDLVPILGTVGAGEPQYAEDHIEGWMAVDRSIKKIHGSELDQYYYLRVHGDSMEPLFNDQDLVLVKQGPVDDGQIAVVLCDGENACVKRVLYLKENQLIMLVSRNPAYPPVMKSIDECKVLGKVILRIGEPRW